MEKLLRNIHKQAKNIGRDVVFMELCGTHSQTVARYNIKSLLPKNVRLISGPGCPVCVTDQSDIDAVVELALAGVPVAAYGDVVGVPGTKMSLEQARQQGAKVHIVYDVRQAVKIAAGYKRKDKNSDLVFFAVGFETTTPMTAWGVKQGLTVYSTHKLFPPAMAALLANPKLKVDGFIDPGHVSAIIGEQPYRQFKIPQVISGFEAEDVLRTIDKLLTQVLTGESRLENDYQRLVKPEGNKLALREIADVFRVADARWRGLGKITRSGLELKKKYRARDAKIKYKTILAGLPRRPRRKSACICGAILQGLRQPRDCKLFGKKCTPDTPEGACMVSVEGNCNIAFRN